MKIFVPFERLEKKGKIEDANYFDRGSCGKIYRVDDKLVKVPYDFHRGFLLNDKVTQWRLYNELKVQDLAVDLGIKFPEVYGIKAVKGDTDIYYPGIFMRDLGVQTFNKLEGCVLGEAERQRKVEIEKARELGFVIKDVHAMNAIWVPGEEQTYLLDAGLCEFKGILV